MSKSKNADNTGHLPLDSMVPIRTVASLTGVNPVTLRAWERRYNLLRPTRTAKGHR
ncbi:MAG: MerR family DNA-binding transcriptional regulator, partial [Candidatus Competibacteraceae bacterium]|nr:MerR family DNA-binding transcriptional regulator [Candidatus Competibacteraceae bacterium]